MKIYKRVIFNRYRVKLSYEKSGSPWLADEIQNMIIYYHKKRAICRFRNHHDQYQNILLERQFDRIKNSENFALNGSL